ncbi:MAG: LysR family transcriptional regulator [Proteobacteria bacterium]|nr:MAG: LysR family transcriptional regulator [Pseudomonadota bacterium]
MDKRKLEIFYHVARLGSFSQAAEHLHIAQSAVSVAIRKLEDELGLLLIDRRERQIQLTVEGKRLSKHATTILRQFQEAQQDMAAMGNLSSGLVSFSTTAMMGSYYFPPLIRQFRQQYPDIDFHITTEGTERVLERINNGDIDMGVVNSQRLTEDQEALKLCDAPVVVCVAQDHPLAKQTAISGATYCQQRLILYQQNYYLRQLSMQLHAAHNQMPDIAVETDLLGMIIQLVREGEGVTLALKVAADAEAGVVGIPFEDPESLSLSLAWSKKRQLSVANLGFVSFLRGIGATQP